MFDVAESNVDSWKTTSDVIIAGSSYSDPNRLITVAAGEWFDISKVADDNTSDFYKPGFYITRSGNSFQIRTKIPTTYTYDGKRYAKYYGRIEFQGAIIDGVQCRPNDYVWYCPEKERDLTVAEPDNDEIGLQNNAAYFYLHVKDVPNSEGRNDDFTVNFHSAPICTSSSSRSSSTSSRSSTSSLTSCPSTTTCMSGNVCTLFGGTPQGGVGNYCGAGTTCCRFSSSSSRISSISSSRSSSSTSSSRSSSTSSRSSSRSSFSFSFTSSRSSSTSSRLSSNGFSSSRSSSFTINFSSRFSSSIGFQVSTSSMQAACLSNECAFGGDEYCAQNGQACIPSASYPCIRCVPRATTSSFGFSSFGTFSSAFTLSSSSRIACASDAACPAGLCLDGSCVECVSDAQCNPTERCIQNQCLTRLEIASLPPFCGNARLDPGEMCDDGSGNSWQPNASCRPDCTVSRCGDGILDTPLEACDDGNVFDNDGCSLACQLERTAPGTLPAQIIELPFQASGSDGAPVGGYTTPPKTTESGPAALLIMIAGAAAGYGWVRKKK